MLISRFARTTTLVALLVGLIPLGAGVAIAEAETDYETLIAKSSPALVTIKCVLKMQGPGGSREIEREFTALMVDDKGTVLCASLQLGTSKSMRRYAITPTDIKVLIGDDTDGVKAKLLASDSELDLTWVQIKEPDAKGYAHIDFTKAATVKLDDRLRMLTRMDKFFDRAPVVNEGRLSGKTKKPRDLLIPSTSLGVEPGMPIFADDGLVIGVVVVQSPDEEEQAAGKRMGSAALILPAADVVKATLRAHETAASEDEEEDEEEEEGEEGDEGEAGADAKKTATGADDKPKKAVDKAATKPAPVKPAPTKPVPPAKPAG